MWPNHFFQHLELLRFRELHKIYGFLQSKMLPSAFLDLIDERNQQEIKKNSKNKDIYEEGTQTNTEIPFTTVAREARNDRKNIVFIDSQVKDYREITKSFRENTEVYLINSNEDGFNRIDEISYGPPFSLAKFQQGTL